MTRKLLAELSRLFALESCDADLVRDYDAALHLADVAHQLRARAEALKPRAVPRLISVRASEPAHDVVHAGVPPTALGAASSVGSDVAGIAAHPAWR